MISRCIIAYSKKSVLRSKNQNNHKKFRKMLGKLHFLSVFLVSMYMCIINMYYIALIVVAVDISCITKMLENSPKSPEQGQKEMKLFAARSAIIFIANLNELNFQRCYSEMIMVDEMRDVECLLSPEGPESRVIQLGQMSRHFCKVSFRLDQSKIYLLCPS